VALRLAWSHLGDDLVSRHSVGSRLHPPPRFNSVVKAAEKKGRRYTKIGNLDTVLEVAKGRVLMTVYCGYHEYYGHCGYCSGASY
jgi:hypothetical protein